MHFCYIFLEWEGFAHNNQVFKDVIDRKKIFIFEKKYWLKNVGYSNCNHLLVFYKRVRYHLKETLFIL